MSANIDAIAAAVCLICLAIGGILFAVCACIAAMIAANRAPIGAIYAACAAANEPHYCA